MPRWLHKNSASQRIAFMAVLSILLVACPSALCHGRSTPSRWARTTDPRGRTAQHRSDPAPQSESQKQQPEGQDDIVKLRSNLVLVPVSVTNASGCLVRDLTAEDF